MEHADLLSTMPMDGATHIGYSDLHTPSLPSPQGNNNKKDMCETKRHER